MLRPEFSAITRSKQLRTEKLTLFLDIISYNQFEILFLMMDSY